MIPTATTCPLNGTTLSRTLGDPLILVDAPSAGAVRPSGEAANSNPFARLVFVFQRNVFLSSELKSLQAKLTRARDYLDAPGSNPVLAAVHLLRLKARHASVLTLLRANRVEARHLLDPV